MDSRKMICKECGEDCQPKYVMPDNSLSNLYGYFGSACCEAPIIDNFATEYKQTELEAQVEWEKEGNLDTEGM